MSVWSLVTFSHLLLQKVFLSGELGNNGLPDQFAQSVPCWAYYFGSNLIAEVEIVLLKRQNVEGFYVYCRAMRVFMVRKVCMDTLNTPKSFH